MNVVELVQAQLSDEVVARLATALNESVPRTRQAMTSGAVPALLSALARRYGGPQRTSAGTADDLSQLLTAGGHDGSLLSHLPSAFGGGAQTDTLLNVGKGMATSLLGGRTDVVVELIAATTALRRSSVSSLLGLAVPLTLAVLGKQRIEHDLDAAGLHFLLAAVPGALAATAMPGLATALGLNSAGLAQEPPGSLLRSFWPWVIVPLAIVLITLALRSCQHAAVLSTLK